MTGEALQYVAPSIMRDFNRRVADANLLSAYDITYTPRPMQGRRAVRPVVRDQHQASHRALQRFALWLQSRDQSLTSIRELPAETARDEVNAFRASLTAQTNGVRCQETIPIGAIGGILARQSINCEHGCGFMTRFARRQQGAIASSVATKRV
jgi:hypothetical protein